ncbi:MAG TPA: GNAT family N-acetyltransferase [Jatrophihabitantaceae bacterium]
MDFRIESRSYDDPDVVRLVAAVQAEYVARYGGPDAAAVDPAEFAQPDGRFLVGILDDEPAVTGGWRRIDDGVVEIKRMYVLDAARRRGLARLMLAELEASALAAGSRRVMLNTGDQQPEAIGLYESSGYLPVDGFGHYACTPGALFYGKDLDPTGRSTDGRRNETARLAQGGDGPIG